MKQKRGNMDWWLVVSVACLGVLLAAGGLWMRFRQPADQTVDEEDSKPGIEVRGKSETQKEEVADSVLANLESEKAEDESEPEKKAEDEPESGKTGEDPEPEMTEEEPEPEMTEEEKQAEREEELVNAFDDLTDEWREPVDSDVPMAEVDKFRQKFNKIPDDRKEECLQRALNLLPDENIMLLAGILTDKEQPREYLELVFNDVLNRDESVKKPLLDLIYKDREHPCWETTAWIFDATGETPEK